MSPNSSPKSQAKRSVDIGHANILVYAGMRVLPQHRAASEWLDRQLTGVSRRPAAPYCIVDLVVGIIRVTTIAERSRQFGTRGAMLFFQWSLS
jgi:predicted nucleic acid-binding protein